MGTDGLTVREGAAGVAAVRHYDPFDYGIHADPYPTYAWMRENAPLYRNEERDFWALSRYADVKDALRNASLFSNRNGISLEPELWGPHAVKTSLFLAMDPPEHGAHRSLVGALFTPKRMAELEDRIRQLARERLEPLRDLPRFDFAADYAAALPNDVLCEMLGVPAEDWDQIRSDTDQLNQREDGSDDRGPNSVAAALRLADYFLGLVKELRRHPGDDVTSTMIESEVDGVKHSDPEVVAFMFLMVSAGNESTGKTIGNAWYHGWRLPDVQRQGLNGRADDWVKETLRFDSASQMTARTLTEDTVIHGTQLNAGARVAVLPASANRDERVFPDAGRFDLDRDTSQLISYGRGPHHCLGSALANLEMRVALEEIGTMVSSYEIDLDRARRVHSPHQRGFASLPCSVVHRPKSGTTGV
ncbi:cytochrome P450 [Streptomyces sp. NPDC005571]|uniref:cytochrome P450 n=1 Tax=Streptomyces sp. NPDC005571 TaxID=3156888 RepID=UPI0033AC0534